MHKFTTLIALTLTMGLTLALVHAGDQKCDELIEVYNPNRESPNERCVFACNYWQMQWAEGSQTAEFDGKLECCCNVKMNDIKKVGDSIN